jgi:hypothetical protein
MPAVQTAAEHPRTTAAAWLMDSRQRSSNLARRAAKHSASGCLAQPWALCLRLPCPTLTFKVGQRLCKAGQSADAHLPSPTSIGRLSRWGSADFKCPTSLFRVGQNSRIFGHLNERFHLTALAVLPFNSDQCPGPEIHLESGFDLGFVIRVFLKLAIRPGMAARPFGMAGLC